MARSCTRCGTSGDTSDEAEGVPLGWSFATSERGPQVMCEQCTRDHVRDIEAKLDEEWWG